MAIEQLRAPELPSEYLWMDDRGIKCKGLTEFLYPNNPSSAVAKAKALCNGMDGLPACPFRQRCLRYAIDNHESFGVWGGTSERDRRKIQRARNRYHNERIYSLEDVRFPTVSFIKRRPIKIRVRTLRPQLRVLSGAVA